MGSEQLSAMKKCLIPSCNNTLSKRVDYIKELMMKKAIFILSMLFFSAATYSQTVCADSLKYFEGEVITVCNKITGTFVTKSSNQTTFLNFGNFPTQLFTVVIFSEDLKNFSYNPSQFLNGKIVCVTGDVRMYNGNAEIIVEQEEQIKIVE